MKNNQSGFALITLLIFMVIAITIIASAAMIVTTTILSGGNAEKGMKAYYVAESGAEDALIRLLRNPTVVTTSPYTLTTTDGTASVTITNSVSGGTITDTVTSTGTVGTTTKKLQIVATYTNGQQTISSWTEIQ